MKRQREQAKREKKALKAEKKALRKNDESDGSGPQIDENVVMETPEDTPVPV